MLPKLKSVCAVEAAGLVQEPATRFWVHPLNADSESHERFSKFYHNIQKYEKKCFEYCRMSTNSLDEMLII